MELTENKKLISKEIERKHAEYKYQAMRNMISYQFVILPIKCKIANLIPKDAFIPLVKSMEGASVDDWSNLLKYYKDKKSR